MDFDLTEEQRSLRDSIVAFARRELNDDVRDHRCERLGVGAAVLAYGQERRQVGQPIGSFQAVAHKLLDMKLRLDTARLLLYRLSELQYNVAAKSMGL